GLGVHPRSTAATRPGPRAPGCCRRGVCACPTTTGRPRWCLVWTPGRCAPRSRPGSGGSTRPLGSAQGAGQVRCLGYQNVDALVQVGVDRVFPDPVVGGELGDTGRVQEPGM